MGAEEGDLAIRIQALCKQKLLYTPKLSVTRKLRSQSLKPTGIARRSLHVGHNRAFIQKRYGRNATEGDQEYLGELAVGALMSVPDILKHPVCVWKRSSFVALTLVFFSLGYIVGLLNPPGFRLPSQAFSPPRGA